MIPIDGQPLLTAAEMRAAEEAAIAAGSSVGELMERAGAGIAEAVRRLAAGSPVLILCGPGNNGGDGYVTAHILQKNGVAVRVMASGEANGQAAVAARTGWSGEIEPLAPDHGEPLVIDALFGTGLSRPLDDALRNALAVQIRRAHLSIAVDVPSGVDSDTGAALGAPYGYDLTLALGALKPAHVLAPAAALSRAVRLVDIGLTDIASHCRVIARPTLGAPFADAHKYSRGLVAVIGGEMPGASALASEAAMRAGAGYVLLLGDEEGGGAPHALVRQKWAPDAFRKGIDGKKAVAVVIGPGLGRGWDATRKLETAIATDRPLVIDGDALHLIDVADLAKRAVMTVLTPHAGEFKAAFGDFTGSKIDAARDAAARSGATIVFKGTDTVIATPSGDAFVASARTSWLSTAGTGDVLAGAIGAMLAAGEAPEAGVWMHAEAARRLGGSFIADDLARELSAVRASL